MVNPGYIESAIQLFHDEASSRLRSHPVDDKSQRGGSLT
jgi:hypothetical protein